MYNVVGVGKGVKNLIESFDQYKEYKTFYLDEEILGNFSSMVDYENNFPVTAVKKKLKGITKNSEVLYVIEGGQNLSGASLRILEILKKIDYKTKVSLISLLSRSAGHTGIAGGQYSDLKFEKILALCI